jgi:hypothetical protein
MILLVQMLVEGEAILQKGKDLLQKEGKEIHCKGLHLCAFQLCTTIGKPQSTQCLPGADAPPRVNASTAGCPK